LYKDDTLVDKQTKEGLVAMKLNMKEKIAHLTKKLGKFTAIANPNLGKEWLDEVSFS